METKEKDFLYADKGRQLERANRFLTMGFVVFYIFVLGLVGTACARGVRTVGYTAMISSIIIVSILVSVIMYRRKPGDVKIRYIATIFLLVVTFFMGFAFDNYYVRFMAAIPMIGCFLFYDKKFTAIFGASVSALNIILNVVKIAVMHT